MASEIERLQQGDPNYAVELLLGPVDKNLVAQDPSTGLRLAGQFTTSPQQFVFKKAHLSGDDFRMFNKEGHLLCVSHHEGKNPYDSLDPLGLQNQPQRLEWKSLVWVSGYQGMPSFKIRPKALSRHGRQHVVDYQAAKVLFSVGNKSRLSTMSIRHNMEVCQGDSSDVVYEIEADLAGRTLQFKNTKGELVAIAAKSNKTMIVGAALGGGSEMELDVAAGVDWTAILACMMAIQQVGAHVVKDAFGNFVTAPLANEAQDAALEATGLDGLANQLGSLTTSGIRKFSQANNMYQQFFK